MRLSLLFTQSINAAAAAIYPSDLPLKATCKTVEGKGFLDAYEPDKITQLTLVAHTSPFRGYIILLGEAVHGIKTDKKSNLEAWQAKLQKIAKAIQESVFSYEPARGDEPVPPNPIPWLSHNLEPKDYDIAEALFLVAEEWKGKLPTYTEVEFSTWEKIHGILGIPPLHKDKDSTGAAIIDAKSLAAMDLWVFLFSLRLRAWPYDPPLHRFEKPAEGSIVKASHEWPHLTKIFKGLVTAYITARRG